MMRRHPGPRGYSNEVKERVDVLLTKGTMSDIQIARALEVSDRFVRDRRHALKLPRVVKGNAGA
jgi:hypothetical protein